jgi:predicted transcriptional regulator
MPSLVDFPDDALADIEYLARSSNRAEILVALATESSSRRELAETTGTSRTTLDRIVNELEERNWITRTTDGDYVATPRGDRVAEESARFAGAMEAIRVLGDAVAWLPEEELTVGIEHFSDATVRRPQPNAASAPSRYATDLLETASEFSCLVNTPPSLGFENAMVNGVLDGRLSTKHVMTEGELAMLQGDPERAARWERYVQGGAEVYCYDGSIPCNLLVIDETVLILERHPEALEGIESTNPTVRSWALGLIDNYRDDASRLDPAVFEYEA